MKSLKRWFWLLTVAVVAGLLVEWLTPSFSWAATAWAWVLALFGSSWQWLTSSSPVPHWLSLGALLVFAIQLVNGAKGLIRRHRTVGFISYTEDTFDNVLWRWTYLKNRITEPIPFCTECGMQLVYSVEKNRVSRRSVLFEHTTALHCENCRTDRLVHFRGRYKELTQKIRRLARRKIDTGEWESVVSAEGPENQ